MSTHQQFEKILSRGKYVRRAIFGFTFHLILVVKNLLIPFHSKHFQLKMRRNENKKRKKNFLTDEKEKDTEKCIKWNGIMFVATVGLLN